MPRVKRKPQTLLLVSHEPVVQLHPEMLTELARWRKRREVTVLGDLFAPEVPFDFIHDVFWSLEVFDKHHFTITTHHWQRWHDLQSSLPMCKHVVIEAAHERARDD